MSEMREAGGEGRKGLPHRDALRVFEAFIKRWSEITLRDIRAEIERIESLGPLDQVYQRARWSKFVDLMVQVNQVIEGRYSGPWGELRLIEEKFGEQLNLRRARLPQDLEARRDWYKRRLAKRFENDISDTIWKHNIASPIEQIFLMEWHFDERPKTLGVRIEPQFAVSVGSRSYVTDFRVSKPGSTLSICIELDGHEFHEKTPEQAAADKRRERGIVSVGHTLLRFTGREVFRSPRACVDEIMALAERVLSPEAS